MKTPQMLVATLKAVGFIWSALAFFTSTNMARRRRINSGVFVDTAEVEDVEEDFNHFLNKWKIIQYHLVLNCPNNTWFFPLPISIFFVLMRVPQSIEMSIMKKFTNQQIVKFQWYEKSLSEQLDIIDSIDIWEFWTNWCRITACHAIFLIFPYSKNGNPK